MSKKRNIFKAKTIALLTILSCTVPGFFANTSAAIVRCRHGVVHVMRRGKDGRAICTEETDFHANAKKNKIKFLKMYKINKMVLK